MAGYNIAIDLGTGMITVFVAGRGIVYKEANAATIDKNTGEIVAIGNSAFEMLGRTPDTLECVLPIQSGVISRFNIMSSVTEQIITKICKNSIFKPNVIVNTPVALTMPEKRTLISMISSGCAGRVSLIETPIACALGTGIGINSPHGVMVVDIGAGTTDISVITMRTPAYFKTLRFGGNDLNEAICQYIKKERGYDIGLHTAEKIKCTVGCAQLPEEELELTVAGKEHITGIPLLFSVTSSEIFKALRDSVKLIATGILDILEESLPELYSDICTDGIILAGGGAKLRGLDSALTDMLKMPVKLSADSENCAAKGAGYALRNIKQYEDLGFIFRMREEI